MASYPGNETFLVGPLVGLSPVYKELSATGKVLPSIILWMLQPLTKDSRQAGEPLCDASKNRMVSVNLVGMVVTYIQDPDAIGDFYNKHNADITKHVEVHKLFEPMIDDFFGSMQTNDTWKSQRKTISHMFFKQRLAVMISVFKEHLNASCDKWLAEIAKNGGTTKIDISVEFERIFAHTINHICFGEDLNDDRFDFHVYDPIKNTFAPKKVSMREAIHNITI